MSQEPVPRRAARWPPASRGAFSPNEAQLRSTFFSSPPTGRREKVKSCAAVATQVTCSRIPRWCREDNHSLAATASSPLRQYRRGAQIKEKNPPFTPKKDVKGEPLFSTKQRTPCCTIVRNQHITLFCGYFKLFCKTYLAAKYLRPSVD